MKKPDPTRFIGKGLKPDELRMRGFSGPLPEISATKEKVPPHPSSDAPKKKDSTVREKSGKKKKEKRTQKLSSTNQPSSRKTKIPRNQDTMVSRYHETIIEIIRKAVRELGKEAATHRFTIHEKKDIAEIIFTYKNRGTKTSENEITRIAVNFILQDYQEHGEESILDKAIKALNE